MDDIELLSGVLTKTGDLIEGVRPDQGSLPTPCPDYDVGALIVNGGDAVPDEDAVVVRIGDDHVDAVGGNGWS